MVHTSCTQEKDKDLVFFFDFYTYYEPPLVLLIQAIPQEKKLYIRIPRIDNINFQKAVFILSTTSKSLYNRKGSKYLL